MKKDLGIQWIRDVRNVISDELDNDPARFVSFHQKLSKEYQQKENAVLTAKEKQERYLSD